MLYYNKYLHISRTILILFLLLLLGTQLCYSQNDTYTKQIKEKIDRSYKENLHHTLESFTIKTIGGKEVYIWKRFGQKVTGLVNFQCIDMLDVGIRDGFEGQINFKEGLKHGLTKIRNCQTGTSYEMNYSNGVLDGYFKAYLNFLKYINGISVEVDSVLYETTFINGNGIWKDYYGNGNLKEVGKYKSGKKEGEWLYYDNENFLYLKQHYNNGILDDSVKYIKTQIDTLIINLRE